LRRRAAEEAEQEPRLAGATAARIEAEAQLQQQVRLHQQQPQQARATAGQRQAIPQQERQKWLQAKLSELQQQGEALKGELR